MNRPRTLQDIPRRGEMVPVGPNETLMTVQTVDGAGLPVVGEGRLDDPETYRQRMALLEQRLPRYAEVLDELDELSIDMGGIGESLPRRQVA